MDTVSIIIPSYGQAKYLAEAIESALAQTHNCEIIVVDDGSTDGSYRIATNYADTTDIKVIRQTNRGLAAARNTGIMNATGHYILPLDADDILMANAAERLLHLADDNPNADVFAPSFQTFGLVHDHVTIMPSPKIEDFRTGNRIGYFSMIRKSALQEVGGYSPKMTFGWEDYHLWFNLLTVGKKIVTTPEVLALYRTKEESMWKESQKYDKELWDQIFKDFPNLLPHA